MVSGPPPSFPWANVHVRVFSCVVAFSILATCSVVLAPMGFRFRYRKVWGFKSLLVHRSETIQKVGNRKNDS